MLTRLVGLFVPIALWAVFFCIRSTTSVSDATTNRTSGLSVPLFRLPKSVQPVKYHLHIINRIHENVLGYIGNVTISLAVKEPTDEIILHAKLLHDLVITLTDVRNDRIYENVEYSLDNVTELLRIYSSSEPLNLQVDEPYQLEILFNGDIRSHHFGFYRTIYKDDNNQTIPLAATQFEPTSARLAFPCFDEPEFKSTFIISITHGSNYSALSNMPVDGEPIISEDGQMTITRFLETPLMPTYLLAFVVSNYNHITETVNGIEHRVFFPPNSKDNGHRALKNAIKSLQALENLLGIEYPLPKLDHIRIEKTYGSAMENWGLITYNNKNFLTSHDGRDKHSILKMIIVQNHEIAHQWFGNLVSPKWWTYAWLNEGFATYFCYLATELVYPEWKVPEFFVDNEVDIMYSWPINRAMTHYVEKESDIKSAFDVVTYQKAACVIKMFHHAIGHKTFIKGIVHYLNKFQYSVADEEDLFRALQHAVDAEEYNLFQGNQTLTDIMHTWTHNEGLPILTVIRNYNDGTITIQQKSSSKHKNETFWIPLNFVSAANPDFGTTTADYIMPPVHEVTIDLKDFGIDLSNNDWLILNKQQTSLQHINYDDQNLMLIAQTLNTDHKKIHLLNRVVLFRDLATVVDKEHGSIEPVLDVLQYLQFEEDLMPWNTAADLIMELNTFLLGSKVHEKFKAFIRVIVGPIFHKYYKLPKIELEASELYARAKIVELACKVDVVECLDYSKALARDYIFHGVKVDSTIRDIVLCQGIKYETEEDFQKIIGKLISTNSTSELYDDIIYSTRCVEQPENLKYFLQMIFKENTTHHVMTDFESFQYVAFIYVSNFFSRPTLLKFMNRNYERLCKTSMVSVMLDRISNYIADDEREEFISLLDHVASIVKYPANIDNHKIGSRVKKPEHFRQKYEENIEAKLKEFDRIRTARSTASHRRPALLAARYIVAAGFISNLISLV